VLSQLGMVHHWIQQRRRRRNWPRRLAVNGAALILTAFILLAVVVLKFHEGGWITLVITGGLVVLAWAIRRHYRHTQRLLGRLDELVKIADSGQTRPLLSPSDDATLTCDPQAKTAIMLVNGFNGLGLHTLLNIFRLFGKTFHNFVFVQIGLIDAGVFKGTAELDELQEHVRRDLDRYLAFMKRHGYYAEGRSSIGTDVAEEVGKLSEDILQRFPQSVLFGGQLVFPHETMLTRLLHNYTIFSLQRHFYHRGVPLVILPIRV
jgi:hypothetical protein